MAERNNATCSICGKGYYKCLSCKDKISATPWKTHTDTAEHYKIYQVIHGFNTGVYTKEDAKNKLKLIDLSDLNDLRAHIKDIIKDIMKEDRKQTKVEEVVVEIEQPIVEKVVEQPSYMNRKKKYSESNDASDVVSDAE